MKNFIRVLNILFISLIAFSCDDFFTSDSSSEPFLGEWSPIVISPDWEAKDYNIYYEEGKNSKFTIKHVPSWLNISSLSGQFTNNNVLLNCKANEFNLFPEIGFYCDYMVLSIENKGNMVVPIAYIVEGNPAVETPNRLTLVPEEKNSISFPIKNTGNGILTWSVLEFPEWLKINDIYGTRLLDNFFVSALPPNSEAGISFLYNPISTSLKELSGKIVLETNDKNNPKVEIVIDLKLP